MNPRLSPALVGLHAALCSFRARRKSLGSQGCRRRGQEKRIFALETQIWGKLIRSFWCQNPRVTKSRGLGQLVVKQPIKTADVLQQSETVFATWFPLRLEEPRTVETLCARVNFEVVWAWKITNVRSSFPAMSSITSRLQQIVLCLYDQREGPRRATCTSGWSRHRDCRECVNGENLTVLECEFSIVFSPKTIAKKRWWKFWIFLRKEIMRVWNLRLGMVLEFSLWLADVQAADTSLIQVCLCTGSWFGNWLASVCSCCWETVWTKSVFFLRNLCSRVKCLNALRDELACWPNLAFSTCRTVAPTAHNLKDLCLLAILQQICCKRILKFECLKTDTACPEAHDACQLVRWIGRYEARILSTELMRRKLRHQNQQQKRRRKNNSFEKFVFCRIHVSYGTGASWRSMDLLTAVWFCATKSCFPTGLVFLSSVFERLPRGSLQFTYFPSNAKKR